MFIAFGTMRRSAYAVLPGRRFCITRSEEELGIGFPNALHCLTNGAVVSGGFLLFQNYMPKFDFFSFIFLFFFSWNGKVEISVSTVVYKHIYSFLKVVDILVLGFCSLNHRFV